MEEARERPQHGPRAGQGIGRAERKENDRKAEATGDRRQEALDAHRTADADPLRPRGHRNRRKGEQHVAGKSLAEHDLEHDTHEDDDQRHPGERGQRALLKIPRCARHTDHHNRGGEEGEEQRIRSSKRGQRKARCPDPPGHGVRGALSPHDRRRRVRTTPTVISRPRAATATMVPVSDPADGRAAAGAAGRSAVLSVTRVTGTVAAGGAMVVVAVLAEMVVVVVVKPTVEGGMVVEAGEAGWLAGDAVDGQMLAVAEGRSGAASEGLP